MKSLSHQFLDFCRSKPRDEEYNFLDPRNCALGQFARYAGIAELYNCPTSEIPEHLLECVHPLWGARSFGALADRLTSCLKAADRVPAVDLGRAINS